MFPFGHVSTSKISKDIQRVETLRIFTPSAKPQRWNEPICKLHRTCPNAGINLWLSRLKLLWRKTLLATVACHSIISKHPRVSMFPTYLWNPMSHQSLKIGYPKIPLFPRIMLYLRVTIELWVHSLFGTSQPQKLKQKVDQVDDLPPKMNNFMASEGGR